MSDRASLGRVVEAAIADLNARVADLRADVDAGDAAAIAPARLAYARALARVITKLTVRRETSFSALAHGAEQACKELADVEAAIRAAVL